MEQNTNWQKELQSMAKTDPWHRECQANMERWEPAYERIKEKLTQKEQEELDQYIAACEEFHYSFACIAYELGKKAAVVPID